MSKVIILLFSVILLTSCNSCYDIKKQEKNSSTKQVLRKKIIKSNLAPGLALIEATLLKRKDNSFTFKVIEILNYGHSTPRIVKSRKLIVNVQDDKLKNKLSENNTNKILLRCTVLKSDEVDLPKWEIVNIENN